MASSYDVYVHYLALKKHFADGKYDFFKYNGKVKASVSAFEKRRDRFYFHKLSKMDDWEGRLLSSILNDSDVWIGNVLDDKNSKIYSQWKRTQTNLRTIFNKELNQLTIDHESFKDMVKFNEEDGMPVLVKAYVFKKISLETLTILTGELKLFDAWSKKSVDNYIYHDINKLVEAYRPFLHYDKKTIQRDIIDAFDTQ